MSGRHPPDDPAGGRLPLLPLAALDPAQRTLRDRLLATRGRGQGAEYDIALPDGRLIGPFNALLRVPPIAAGLFGWTRAIAAAGLPPDVREVVILTVGGRWQADYMLYAHMAVARQVGVPDAAIETLRRGGSPADLRDEAAVAHRLARALVRDHRVPQDLYADAVGAFGVAAVIALVNLVGQYQNTAAILACFQVPAPPHT